MLDAYKWLGESSVLPGASTRVYQQRSRRKPNQARKRERARNMDIDMIRHDAVNDESLSLKVADGHQFM